jgi:hypothetical protein
MSDKDYYPAGAYNDPNAPYNQPEPIEDTDAFADMKEGILDDRVKDLNGWLLESLSEAPLEFMVGLSVMISSDMPADRIGNQLLGKKVRAQVIAYCTPTDDEVIEQLTPHDEER